MSTLHTVNRSPFEKSSLVGCIQRAARGSGILLYEDAVYAADRGTTCSEWIRNGEGLRFFVLGADLAARGLAAERLVDGVEVIDYGRFVDLAVEYDKVVAWV